jgi:prepilin signal peptidase PulO-like enzyme (type II secretory pathway)
VRVRDKRELTENLGTIYPDGLLENQSESLKKFLKKENITEIEIFKTFPFIPFIFASAIITIIIGDSISHWIVGMMRNIHF